MTMSLTIERHGRAALVSLGGEVDLSNSMDVRKEVVACLNDRWDVVVDMAHVRYIDSSGIASLIEGYQTAKRYGVRFALSSVSAPALRVLKMARLDSVFTIFEQTAEALTAEA
ncbi:MAG TPA: STAS domain-containing protein [Candidatus Sulfotelmatobacter sp.]|jgi:anti-sigma B factor antagonist|nr:STAS domain-containing protein [Candidatus Sulfotelmatobacter sp.]